MSDDKKKSILKELCEPLVRFPAGETDVLRIGLVLNGTVSAGAWTAGALDALFEALDAWDAARARGEPVPRHRVRIEVVGGASGGAVCAALLARAASRAFPHVRDPKSKNASDNPFWKVWVDALDAPGMLETASLGVAGASVASVLSGKAIGDAMQAMLAWQGTGPMHRSWLADPFHVVVTQTNLQGVPYQITYAAGETGAPRRSKFVSHADHAHFAFLRNPNGPVRGDSFPVDLNRLGDPAWETLADHARASGAFPIGFPSVRIEDRPRAHYAWRGIEVKQPDGTFVSELLEPDWPPPTKDRITYDAVDGGALNNSPLGLVREGLVGLGNSLPPDAQTARTTLLVMDPFASLTWTEAGRDPPDLFKTVGMLAGTLVAHARFSTSDLRRAQNPNDGSRFLFTAGRTPAEGAKVFGDQALSTSGLHAFVGFCFRDLRVHDFLLGRANMLAWLEKYFTLPAQNPVFGGFGTDPGAGRYLRDASGGTRNPDRLPIIPIMQGVVRDREPSWPQKLTGWSDLADGFRQRVEAVVTASGKIGCASLIAPIIGGRARSELAAGLRKAIDEIMGRR